MTRRTVAAATSGPATCTAAAEIGLLKRMPIVKITKKPLIIRPISRNRFRPTSILRLPTPSARTRTITSVATAVSVRTASIGTTSKCWSMTLETGTLAPQLRPTNTMAAKAPSM